MAWSLETSFFQTNGSFFNWKNCQETLAKVVRASPSLQILDGDKPCNSTGWEKLIPLIGKQFLWQAFKFFYSNQQNSCVSSFTATEGVRKSIQSDHSWHKEATGWWINLNIDNIDPNIGIGIRSIETFAVWSYFTLANKKYLVFLTWRYKGSYFY